MANLNNTPAAKWFEQEFEKVERRWYSTKGHQSVVQFLSKNQSPCNKRGWHAWCNKDRDNEAGVFSTRKQAIEYLYRFRENK